MQPDCSAESRGAARPPSDRLDEAVPTDLDAAGFLIACLALMVAAGAGYFSWQATKAARRSASASEQSAEAAARSAGVAEREEQRRLEEAELRAVVWRPEREGDAVLKLWNAGDSTAFDVHVDVSPGARVVGIPDVAGEAVRSGDGVRVGASTRDFDAGDEGLVVRWRGTPDGAVREWTYRL